MAAELTPIPDWVRLHPIATLANNGHITLRGELDTVSAPALSEAMMALYRSKHQKIVVEASQVTFLGAAGLSVLMQTYNFLAIDGRTLTLHRPSRAVRRILEITGLDAILPIISEVE